MLAVMKTRRERRCPREQFAEPFAAVPAPNADWLAADIALYLGSSPGQGGNSGHVDAAEIA